MDINFEQKVREKAYEIWQAAGMQDGLEHEHWVAAEQVVLNEVETPKAKKAKVVAKKPAKAAAPKTAAKKPATAKPAAKSAKASTKH